MRSTQDAMVVAAKARCRGDRRLRDGASLHAGGRYNLQAATRTREPSSDRRSRDLGCGGADHRAAAVDGRGGGPASSATSSTDDMGLDANPTRKAVALTVVGAPMDSGPV